MTPQEPTPAAAARDAADAIVKLYLGHQSVRWADVRDDIALALTAALTAARADERERCAKVCESMNDDRYDHAGYLVEGDIHAKAIRAQGDV